MTKWLLVPFQLTSATKVQPAASDNWQTIRYINRADLHRNPCYILIVHSGGARRDELERAIDSVRWNPTPVILLVHHSQRAFVEDCLAHRVEAPLEKYTGSVLAKDQQNWIREIVASTTPPLNPDQVRLELPEIQQMPPQTDIGSPQTGERTPMNPFEGTLIWTDDDNRRLIVLIALFPGRLDLIQKYYSGHRDIFGTANAINTYYSLARDNVLCIAEEDGRPLWEFLPDLKGPIEQFVETELCLNARAARAARGSQTIVATDLGSLKRRAEDMFIPEKLPLYFGELADEQHGFFGRGFILNAAVQERQTSREYLFSTMEYESWRAAVGTRTDLRQGRMEKLEQVAGFHLQAQTLLGGDIGYKILFAPAFSNEVVAAAAGFMHRASLLDWLNLTYLSKFKAENDKIDVEKAKTIFSIRTGIWNVWRSLEPFKNPLY